MDINSAFAVAALLALRLALPVAATLLVSYLLVRLDEKWQTAERARLAHGLAGAVREAPRCWEINGCDPAAAAACQARALRPLPCWLAQRRLTGRLPDRCFTCPVFVNA
jgi:hypothetical protein